MFSPVDIPGPGGGKPWIKAGSSEEKLGIQMHPFLRSSNLLWVAGLRFDSPKVCLFSANISGFVFSNHSCFSWGISGTILFPMSLGNHRTGTVDTHYHRSQVDVVDQREELGQGHIHAVFASLWMQPEVTLVTDVTRTGILPHFSPVVTSHFSVV